MTTIKKLKKQKALCQPLIHANLNPTNHLAKTQPPSTPTKTQIGHNHHRQPPIGVDQFIKEGKRLDRLGERV